MKQVHKLLTLLEGLIRQSESFKGEKDPVDYKKELINEKLNNKLIQQLQDPLVLAFRSLSGWCKSIHTNFCFRSRVDSTTLRHPLSASPAPSSGCRATGHIAVWPLVMRRFDTGERAHRPGQAHDVLAHQAVDLFPVAYPKPNFSVESYKQHYDNVIEIFHFMGIFLA